MTSRVKTRHRLDPGLWIGTGLVGIVLVLGFIGPLILGHPDAMSSFYLAPPGTHGFWLGTDQYGRSELTRIVWGIRTSLEISFSSIGVAVIIGTIIGLLSAANRAFDLGMMRVMDVLLAFPAILLAIGIMAMVGPGVAGVIEAITIVYIPIFARVSRAPALEQLSKEFVEAGRSLGASTSRILFRHVLPNIWPVIVIQLSLGISDAILIEAALSYLGLGVVPPAASLGELLRSGQSLMFTAPWTAIFPGIAIAIAVLGFNVLGDAVRDRSAVRGK
ncbi:MAG: hypothetical protein C7B46_14560 [Sulfobacillus benefaciens]|uniref:ABC transmembrane type-1 domain-containing protein n=1 Tax=Sulfobacillus benefaciens TaxID=453960 RepID=A0A2T2XD41_9FIRM|nr:MAG: hypothetical protein C7B46_14560 [Sulfobacillus benefaciens]